MGSVEEIIAHEAIRKCPPLPSTYILEMEDFYVMLTYEVSGKRGVGGSDGEGRREPYFYIEREEIRVSRLLDEDGDRPDMVTKVQQIINDSIR